ncbi:TonB-dependent receptor [Spongiibacter taiwanensis]|uniref:TonB-dependent receptor n=1 Tax=Spongiibacter taiwanensis TaxID=1748242 RepID=UPI002035ED79|nr:TonB-dependent receptor [Spongiibacter taiwanensis]USA41999.1 TonB-dependent receptor [Spongiibacter taiwanensis]
MKNYKFYFILFAGAISAFSNAAVIEEVIVTAQKRDQNAQDVPIAVTAIKGESLERLGLSNGSEIASQIPNVQVQKPYGDAQPIFAIRGIVNSDYKATTASPVGVYVDEVYLGVPTTHGLQLFDVDRIEILRGPQGTLFGKNTTGGAVSVSTALPSGERGGYVGVGVGNFNRIDLKGAYETALIPDILDVRGAINSSKADGHFENKEPGKDDLDSVDYLSARGVAYYRPTSGLDVIFRYTIADQDSNAPTITPGGTNIGGYKHEGSAFDVRSDYVEAQTNKFDLASLSVSYSWDEYFLTSITGLGDGDYLNKTDTDGSPLDIITVDWGTSFEQISEDLRFGGGFDWYNFIFGLYLSRESVEADNFYQFGRDRPDAFNGTQINQNLELRRDSLATYGQASFDITSELAFTVGLRYSVDTNMLRDFEVDWIDGRTGLPSPVALAAFGSTRTVDIEEREFENKELSGKLGFDYKVDEASLLYFSYSRGYRSGAFNTGALFESETEEVLEPEIVDAYEIGFKAQLWGRQAQLNSAIFYYDYQDQQFVNVVGISQLLASADKSSVIGVESELLLKPTDRITINTGLGILETEYKKLELDVALDALGSTSRSEDLSGNKLLAAPEVNFNFSIDYVVPFESSDLIFHLDTMYASEQFFTAFNDYYDEDTVGADFRGIKQESYWMSNARITYEIPDKGISFAAWCKNLENKEIIAYSINAQAYGGFDFNQYLKPRTFGVEVKYIF